MKPMSLWILATPRAELVIAAAVVLVWVGRKGAAHHQCGRSLHRGRVCGALWVMMPGGSNKMLLKNPKFGKLHFWGKVAEDRGKQTVNGFDSCSLLCVGNCCL